MILVCLTFLILGGAATAFAAWPAFRREKSARAGKLLAAAVSALIWGVGGGTYLVLGNPALAVRTFAEPSSRDLPGLIAALAQRVRARPNDARGWTLLGRGYLTLGDTADAAGAFKRAISAADPADRAPLYSAYGEALTLSAEGSVSDEAQTAFEAALAQNPKDLAARYYLGVAYAARRKDGRALALWESLLADAPPDATWREGLVDRIAALRSRNGSTPNVGAMVQLLAVRLRSHPNDPEGWGRLVKAWAVLGDTGKARAALSDARNALRNDSAALAQLSLEAKHLKLE
ncbi:MAG: tetratricopeptide repeat protein [Rhizomicrobium sp.]